MNLSEVIMKANQVLILVINKIEAVDALLDEFYRAGVKGATVINSTGMAHALAGMEDSHIISSLRAFFSREREENKTIFMVADDETVKVVRSVVTRVIGDLSLPNTGIMFSVPILFAEGIATEDAK